MFLTGSLQSYIRGASKSAVASPAALQYSTQDVMMVLVNMQKEAQRREASFQRSLMQLKQSLQAQVSDEDTKINTYQDLFPLMAFFDGQILFEREGNLGLKGNLLLC